MSGDFDEMTFEEKVEYVKTTVSPADLAEMAGLEPVNGKIFSPFNPEENTPSCHLYDDHWFDFSTGRGGDVIDLYLKLKETTWQRAINDLGRKGQSADFEPGRVTRAVKAPPEDMTDRYNAALRDVAPERLDWWQSRLPGVHVGLLAAQRIIGFEPDGTMLVPHRTRGGGIHGVKVRHLDGGKSAYPGSQFGHSLYWPGAYHPLTLSTVVITEGESDCWALLQQPTAWAVCALPSGAGLWRDDWLTQLETYETIYTAFDNDRAGEQATERVRRAVGWGRWKELKVPTLYNDVREAIAAGWKPAPLNRTSTGS